MESPPQRRRLDRTLARSSSIFSHGGYVKTLFSLLSYDLRNEVIVFLDWSCDYEVVFGDSDSYSVVIGSCGCPFGLPLTNVRAEFSWRGGGEAEAGSLNRRDRTFREWVKAIFGYYRRDVCRTHFLFVRNFRFFLKHYQATRTFPPPPIVSTAPKGPFPLEMFLPSTRKTPLRSLGFLPWAGFGCQKILLLCPRNVIRAKMLIFGFDTKCVFDSGTMRSFLPFVEVESLEFSGGRGVRPFDGWEFLEMNEQSRRTLAKCESFVALSDVSFVPSVVSEFPSLRSLLLYNTTSPRLSDFMSDGSLSRLEEFNYQKLDCRFLHCCSNLMTVRISAEPTPASMWEAVFSLLSMGRIKELTFGCLYLPEDIEFPESVSYENWSLRKLEMEEVYARNRSNETSVISLHVSRFLSLLRNCHNLVDLTFPFCPFDLDGSLLMPFVNLRRIRFAVISSCDCSELTKRLDETLVHVLETRMSRVIWESWDLWGEIPFEMFVQVLSNCRNGTLTINTGRFGMLPWDDFYQEFRRFVDGFLTAQLGSLRYLAIELVSGNIHWQSCPLPNPIKDFHAGFESSQLMNFQVRVRFKDYVLTKPPYLHAFLGTKDTAECYQHE